MMTTKINNEVNFLTQGVFAQKKLLFVPQNCHSFHVIKNMQILHENA